MSQFQVNQGDGKKRLGRKVTIAIVLAALTLPAFALISDIRRTFDPSRNGIPPRSDGSGGTIHTLITKIIRHDRVAGLLKWEIRIPSNVSVCEPQAISGKPNECFRPTVFDGNDGQGEPANDFLTLKFDWPSLELLGFSENEAKDALGHVDVVLKRQTYPAENWNLYFALDRDDYFLRTAVLDDGVEQYNPKPGTSTDETDHYPFAGDVDEGGIFLVRDAQGKRIANFGCDHDCFGITEVQNHMVKFQFDKKMVGDAGKIIAGIRQRIADFTVTSKSPDAMSGNATNVEAAQ